MERRFQLVGGVVAALLAGGMGTHASQQRGAPAAARWVTAWGASQQTLGPNALSNTTVRMIARVTASGDAVRIRIDNAFGTTPLTIGGASVGVRVRGAALAAGSSRPVTFQKVATVTVPPAGTVTSDQVVMRVDAGEDLAISLFVPESVRPSQHTAAQVTSYIGPDGAGDLTTDESATRFSGTVTSMLWLKAVDVLSSPSTGAIVAFGDSITDGTCSTVDAHDRWVDLLALRLQLDARDRKAAGAHKAVVNEGIGGNTVTREHLNPAPDSPPGTERLDRDVLSHHGVTHVILFMGTNDVRRDASGAQVRAGIENIIKRVKAAGKKIVGVTIIPRHNQPASQNNTGWNADKTRIRVELNQWIRTRAPFDSVIDFDQMVRDPVSPDLIYPPYGCGDGVHPSPFGYSEMGRSLPLISFNP